MTTGTETKPGVMTTEFWITVVGFALGVVQEAVGVCHISDSRVVLFQSVLLAAYNVARGLAKQGVKP
jgi:hypothetical protein